MFEVLQYTVVYCLIWLCTSLPSFLTCAAINAAVDDACDALIAEDVFAFRAVRVMEEKEGEEEEGGVRVSKDCL